ncbi:MAG TPA: DsbA family protein [Sphingomonadaceae bacterium]|nr:DsbA family protein [Sphingomonadaceae bacterium]
MKRAAQALAPLFALAAGLLLAGASPAADQGAAFRASLTNAPLAPGVKPKAYDVTIVLYFDYQCAYCKKQHLSLMDLLQRDPKVRVVYRDWPVFGAVSQRAARLAIASQFQGRHAAFHDALMRTQGKLDEAALKAAARTAKVDWERLQADLAANGAKIDALMRQTQSQAAQLQLEGTPGMVVGNYIVPGAMNITGLMDVVKRVRAN